MLESLFTCNFFVFKYSADILFNFLLLGQKVIWDALKAAVAALQNGDLPLAQAIIDGANITLPHGNCAM